MESIPREKSSSLAENPLCGEEAAELEVRFAAEINVTFGDGRNRKAQGHVGVVGFVVLLAGVKDVSDILGIMGE